jgi:hypothetical protein
LHDTDPVVGDPAAACGNVEHERQSRPKKRSGVARKLNYGSEGDNGDRFRELFGGGENDDEETEENHERNDFPHDALSANADANANVQSLHLLRPCGAGSILLSQLPLHNHEPDVAAALLARWRLVILRRVVENYNMWMLPEDSLDRTVWCNKILDGVDRSGTDGKKIHSRPLSRESDSMQRKVVDYMNYLIQIIVTSSSAAGSTESATAGMKLFVIYNQCFQ